MKRPIYGRRESFDHVMDLLRKRRNPVIVEVGMTRKEGDWLGAGYSTPLFAWYVSAHGGEFHSVDIDPAAVSTSKRIIRAHGIPFDRVNLVQGDGIAFVRDFPKDIDLLYLDGWDYSRDPGPGEDALRKVSEEAHLECWEAARPHLRPGGMVLIDDMYDPEGKQGKGRLLIPRLLEEGHRLDPGSRSPLEAQHGLVVYQFLFFVRRPS